jgi:hypothetical protein
MVAATIIMLYTWSGVQSDGSIPSILPHDRHAVLDPDPRAGYPQALVDAGSMLSLSRGVVISK